MKLVPEGSLLDRWQCSHVDTLAVCYLDLLGTNMTDLFIVLQGNPWHAVDKFRPGQNGRYFANGLFKSSKKEHFDILIKISLNFGSWGSTWQYISIGIWHLTGDMLLPGPMLTRIFHYNYVIMAAMASQITSLAIVCSTGYRSNKISKLRVTVLCAGNSPVTGEFPAQRANNTENVSIWWRHHVTPLCY